MLFWFTFLGAKYVSVLLKPFFSISFCLTTKDTHITCTKAPTVLEVVIDLILRQILIYLKRKTIWCLGADFLKKGSEEKVD